MTRRLIVLPAAPVLLPDKAQTHPAALDVVMSACDAALASYLDAVPEVLVISAGDRFRDLEGPAEGSSGGTGARVADFLLDRVGFRGVRVHVNPRERDRGSAVVLAMADGAASLGAKAPRPGPATFDEELTSLLGTGDLTGLRAVSDTGAAAAGCVTADVWRRVAELAEGDWVCDDLRTFAPFGVRYYVGSWTTKADTR